MTLNMENDPKAFVMWLQGFFEISGATSLDTTQVQIIKEHLALVLNKKTPTAYQVNLPTFPTGPKCGACNKPTSEEGGVCKKCRNTSASQIPIVDVPTCLTC